MPESLLFATKIQIFSGNTQISQIFNNHIHLFILIFEKALAVIGPLI